jgi:hypothetical protein
MEENIWTGINIQAHYFPLNYSPFLHGSMLNSFYLLQVMLHFFSLYIRGTKEIF